MGRKENKNRCSINRTLPSLTVMMNEVDTMLQEKIMTKKQQTDRDRKPLHPDRLLID